MPNQNQFQPPYGDGDNVIINNYGTLVCVTGDQSNSVGHVVNSNILPPNTPPRRSLQRVRHALALVIKLLPIAAGFMAYWLTKGELPFG